MKTPPLPTALQGVTVLELGSRVGAAICGSLLMQLGATVVCVEDPTDPRADTKWRQRAQLAAGKLSVAAGATDSGLLASLALRCDVALLSSDIPAPFGPVELAPGAVSCDVTAFGSFGPMRGQACSDVQIQALSGVLDSTGHADGPPVPVGIPLVEVVAGIYAAGAVLTALRVRRLQGAGQPIEIALYDVAFSLMTSFLPTLLAGQPASAVSRVGNRQTMVAPWNVFHAADGWILLCAGNDEQWRRVCDVVERAEMGRAAGFATVPERLANVTAVDAIVGTWVAGQTVVACVAQFAAASIPCGPIAPIEGHPQEDNLGYRGMLLQRHDPVSGRDIHMPGSPLRMQRSPGRAATHIPLPNGDRPAIEAMARRELSLKPAAAPGVLQPALAGLRVVEVGHYTTAPLAARHLANLGAEVIKIEPLEGEPVRHWPPLVNGQGVFFTFQNADKRSVVLDLRSPAGLASLRTLLAGADVLIENLKPGALVKYGLTAEALHAINPGLVYCSVTGFGHDSMYAGRPAFDAVIQATSGLMDVVVAEGAPLKTGPSSADVMGAAMSFAAIAAALEYRDRTGLGQHLDLSMQDIGAWATQAAWNRTAGLPMAGSVEACLDGYVCVQRDGAPLTGVLDRLTRDQAVTELATQGIHAVPVRTVAEVVTAEQTLARRLWFDVEQDGLTYKLLASPLRLGLTPATVRRPGPAMGRDTDAVLARSADSR